MRTISRRHFLRATGFAAAAAAGQPIARVLAASTNDEGVNNPETISYNEIYGNPPMLGRVEAKYKHVDFADSG